MNAALRDFLTGAVAIAGGAAMVVTLVLVGEAKDLRVAYYPVVLRLDTAAGLSSTSAVNLNGVRVGTVATVVPPADPAMGVEVRLRIREGVRIPRGVTVFVDRSLVGDATLDLSVPRTGRPVGDWVGPGEAIDAEVQTLVTRVESSVGPVLDRISSSAATLDRLAVTYEDVGRSISDMLAPRTPAEVRGGAPANLRSALATAEDALAAASSWLGDEGLRREVDEAARRLNEALEGVSRTAAAWERVSAAAEKEIGASGEAVREAASAAREALSRVDAAAEQVAMLARGVSAGEGSLGMLARNPDLYLSLRDAAQRLEKALVEWQLLAEKYRTEGLRLR